MKKINLKEKLPVIIGLLILSIIIVLLIIFILKNPSKKINEDKEDINYKKPKKFAEITSISIRYNKGKDIITISNEDNYLIHYYGIDLEGNIIKNDDQTDKINTNPMSEDVKKYITKSVISNLKRYKEGSNDWYININVESASSTIRGKKGTEPKWFLELLKKLEVNKYGNMSLQKK